MELILVRHALPLRREVDSGPADPELSPIGHRQAALMADYLAAEPLHALYVSPLRRARETAEHLAKATSLSPVVVDGVAELDRHSSIYVPLEEAMADDAINWRELWGADEDQSAFRDVVVDALEELIAAHPGQRIVVVCHGGVINMFLGYVLGTDARLDIFTPQYTGVHRVLASRRGHRQILTVNEVSHLRGTNLLSWDPLG